MGLESQDAVSHIVVMGHLHLVEQHHILQFRGIPYHRSFSNDGIAPDKGTVPDFRLLVNDKGTVQAGCRRYFGIPGNPDRFPPFLIDLLWQGLPQGYDIIMDPGKYLPGIRNFLKQSGCKGLTQSIQVFYPNGIHLHFTSFPLSL